MSSEASKRLVHEGEFVAEVSIDLVADEGAWAPYLSVADANKLDEVRDALRAGDLRRAATLSDRVYRLTPLTLADVG